MGSDGSGEIGKEIKRGRHYDYPHLRLKLVLLVWQEETHLWAWQCWAAVEGAPDVSPREVHGE